MPVVMETILLPLLLAGVWAQELNTTPTPTQNLISMTSNHTATRVSEKNDSTSHKIATPSTPDTADEVPSLETPVPGSVVLSVSEPAISQEISSKKPSPVQEHSTAISRPTVPTMTDGTMTTRSLETANGTTGFPVTMATGSPEASNGTGGHLVTMANSSLGISEGTSAPSVTMAAGTLETSKGASGLPVTTTPSFLKTPMGTSSSPVSRLERATTSTSGPSGIGLSPNSDQGTKHTLLVAVLVALLVVIVLLALLLLWRRRQKRRTGALTLSGGGKRNGVADAWAGPAQVTDEEAVIITGGASGGDKGSGGPEGEGAGRRPTLTTFFGRRKSRQGSLALEELKAGPALSMKGEEEPLVASEDEALEAPASEGTEAGNAEVL